MIVVKNLTTGTNWETYHRSTGATKKLELNETSAASTNSGTWMDTEPTESVFTVGSNNQAAQDNYIAYLFAHDDASFGTDGDESIIKCGTYTGTGGANNATTEQAGPDVNLGFEPQFVMVRSADSADNWYMFDTMRGFPSNLYGPFNYLQANEPAGEGTFTTYPRLKLTSTGFKITAGNGAYFNYPGQQYIYMAIRRPNKPPVYGTDVFNAVSDAGSNSARTIHAGNLVDLQISRSKTNTSYPWHWLDRLRGPLTLNSSSTSSESGSQVGSTTFDSMNGIEVAAADGWSYEAPYGGPYIRYFFTRATGFMDIVAYEGTGTNSAGTHQVVNHNLGVSPELVIVKNRDATKSFFVWSSHTTENTRMSLDDTAPSAAGGGQYWQANSTFTDTQFGLGYGVNTNKVGDSHIAYLFASRSNVSKIGTYSGSTSDVNVDCGFAGGARFVLIKRTDAEVMDGYTGMSGWYIWDKTRGIQSGNDPYIRLDTVDAQVIDTDYIDPLGSGFVVTSSAPDSLNVNGGTYLFLAIA
jgi:hypothetical protein